MTARDDFFRSLCENASDLIQSVSSDGRFLYVNEAWRRTLGYGEAEISVLSVMDIVHPDSLEHCERIFREIVAEGRGRRVEAVFRAKSGVRVPVEGSVSVHREGDRPLSTVGIFRDISRRRLLEEELDRFFRLSIDLLCVAGIDGYFREVNPAFEEVLGYTREELLSRSFLEFVHPDDRTATLGALEHLAHGRPVVDFVNRYGTKAGAWRWLAWRSASLPERGLAYAVARDVTEEKEMQALLARQTEELARSNADLEQFASVASHDLRAPLRAVIALASFIEEDLGQDLAPTVREHVDEMRSRLKRLDRLIGDLLDYSRAGRVRIAVERVDTGVLVRDVVNLLALPAAYTVAVADGMPTVETARAPLEQVFRNLIGNAAAHHDRPTGRVDVSARPIADGWEFRVSDDGPGIGPGRKATIFRPFERQSARGDSGGAGLGLAIVKRQVEAHGGAIRVESGAERGTAFVFTWPSVPRRGS